MSSFERSGAPEDGRSHEQEVGDASPDAPVSRRSRVWGKPRKIALMPVMVVVAAAALLIGIIAAWGLPSNEDGHSQSVTSRQQMRLAAAAHVRSEDPSCDKPTLESVQTTGHSGVSIESVESEESVGVDFLKMLGEGAFTFGEDEGLGWLLSVVTGEQPGLDPAQVDAQFDQVNAKLDALSLQQYDDCTALLAALAQAKTNSDKDAYDNLVTPMATQIGLIVTYQQDYDDILTALGQNGGDVNALSSTYKDDMKDMLAGGPTGVRNIVNTVNQLEGGDQPGAKAMVSFFSQILTDELGYDPYKTHVFPDAFVDSAYAQQGYYAGIVDQAVYLDTNVAHLDFTDGDYVHSSDPASVVSLVNVAQKDIHSWSVSFSDGPAGDGTPNWVSQGKGLAIGAIPAGTVLDYRVQRQPLLWTTSPVGLNGEPASPAPYYCASNAQFCYADQYNGSGKVGSTALAVPSAPALPAVIAADDYDDVSGWRVPTSSDWAALVAGATGGLTSWGDSHQLGLFGSQKTVSHYGGSDQSLTTIAPMLVNTGTSTAPSYGVLTSTDPSANNLTLVKPNLPSPAQNDAAGRLFLTMDFEPAAPPTPFSVNSLEVRSPRGLATTTAAPALAQAKQSKATGAGKHRAAVSLTDVPGPTTFSTPAVCSSNNSYTVPAGVGSVRISVTGAAGAPGEVADKGTAPGGVGGVVTETVPMTAGNVLYVQVGGAGSTGDSRRGGSGGGGTGGVSKSDTSNAGDYSGGGGGASGVATTPDCSHWLAVAGGGGGGGAGQNAELHDPEYDGGSGGNGCATVSGCKGATDGAKPSGQPLAQGHAGGDAPDNHGGDCGRTGAGNPYGLPGANGATMQGGNGGTNNSSYNGGGGGGGGAGYYGGGGGGGSGWNAAGGGGGGGASFAIPGATDVSYGLGSGGQNGSVTITPIVKAPLPITLMAEPTDTAWALPLPVTLTATAPADATGTISFYDEWNDLQGTAPIRHGVATLAGLPVPIEVGDRTLSAVFSGDDHYAANRAETHVTVVKATPSMVLTVSGTILKSGQAPKSLVLQMPTYINDGSVRFYDDVNGGCQGKTGQGVACQVEGDVNIEHGYATLTKLAVPLVPGTNRLYAYYGGDPFDNADSHFNPNTSNVVPVTVGS